jgi:hypothetical protein
LRDHSLLLPKVSRRSTSSIIIAFVRFQMKEIAEFGFHLFSHFSRSFSVMKTGNLYQKMFQFGSIRSLLRRMSDGNGIYPTPSQPAEGSFSLHHSNFCIVFLAKIFRVETKKKEDL